MCRHNKRSPELPDARANNMKSELRKERASAQTTRAAAAHPRHPSRRNVMAAETIGDTFSGIRARTVISRKSQGKDRKRSVPDMTIFSTLPPLKPAVPPMRAASRLDSSAAAGANSNDTRVP